MRFCIWGLYKLGNLTKVCTVAKLPANLDLAKGREALDFLKKEGGCSMMLSKEVRKQEWYNQKRERKNYFHSFLYGASNKYSWMALTTDPYAKIYNAQFVLMEQAGMMEKLTRQQVGVWKPAELGT